MLRRSVTISPEQEIEILQFWAQAMDMKRTFTPEQIASVRGLSEAIEAALKLPGEIGWGDDHVVRRRTAATSRAGEA